jgi:hypothetical protein
LIIGYTDHIIKEVGACVGEGLGGKVTEDDIYNASGNESL